MKPVDICVNGYAEFPQISVSLPRPEIHEDIETAYRAIASITSGYLVLLRETEDEESPHDLIDFNEIDQENYNYLSNIGWLVVTKEVRNQLFSVFCW